MLMAAIVGIGIFTYCNIHMWTPLQQWYWVQYLSTKSFPTARGDYKLLTTVDAQGKQLMAVDADVVPGPMQGWPPFSFALTPKARQRGAVTLKVDTARDKSFERHAVADERELICDALKRSMGEARFAEIRERFEKRIQSGDSSRLRTNLQAARSLRRG
jgi:hypothetical protein